MTKFEDFKNMNIDELAEWLNQYGNEQFFDTWFAEKYCENCDRVVSDSDTHDYAYCELNDDCQMCPGHDVTKNNTYIIKMWLSQEK